MTEPIDDLRRRAGDPGDGPNVHDEREREAAAISADLVKLGASGLGVAYALLGYSYSAQFFRGFGMSISDVDLTYLDLFHRGVVLTLEPVVFAVTVGAFLFLYGVYRMRVHHRLPPRLVPLVAVLFLLSAVFFGVKGGQGLGDAHARQVWWEGTRGKPAYCFLHVDKLAVISEPDEPETTIAQTVHEWSLAGDLRLIHRSEDHVYLAPVLTSPLAENFVTTRDVEGGEGETPVVGESYAIPNDVVDHCRVQSADLGGPEPGAGDV